LTVAEARALETGERLAIFYLDLDDFKEVNDTLGHQAGDDLLRRVAARLSQVVSDCDCLARVGGDEFVALIQNAQSHEVIAPLRRRLVEAVQSETGVSCGLAIFPDDGHTAEAVVREADAAMFRVKRNRRMLVA
jgi:diguanylate cyclase (GGDEF)-like protein